MASKININLDTSKENYLVAKCKQNDDLTLEASIFENGLALDLTNKTITIQALKSDNTYIIQNTDIVKENNKINAELDRDFSRVPGTTKIEIVLVESSKQNTTFSFYLEVVGSVIRGAVQSSNTATILEALDNKIIEAGQVKQETEELVQSGGAATKGEVQEINASLEQMGQQKADNSIVNNELAKKRDKSTSIMLSDLHTEVKTAMTGGSVAVVGIEAVGKENVKEKSIDARKTTFIECSNNLYNKNNVISGYLINTIGEMVVNTPYKISDFIEVIPSKNYFLKGVASVCQYDSNKQFLRRIDAGGDFNNYEVTLKNNTDCYYWRLNVLSHNQARMNKDSDKGFDEYFLRLNDISVNGQKFEDNSIPVSKIQGEINSDKRTSLGERANILYTAPYKKPNIDTVNKKIQFFGNTFVYYRNTRYQLSTNASTITEIDYSGIWGSSGRNVLVYFNIDTKQFITVASDMPNLIPEKAIFICLLIKNPDKNNEIISVDATFEYTLDNKDRFVTNKYLESVIPPKKNICFVPESLYGTLEMPQEYLYNESPIITAENLKTEYSRLATNYNSYLTMTILGKDQSNTYDIYKINLKPKELVPSYKKKTLPKICFTTGVHGGEKGSVYATYYLTKALCENWKSNPMLEYLRHNVEIEFIALASPWAYENITAPTFWGRTNVNMVDMNRNQSYGWRMGEVGTISYGGASAVSEAESIIIKSFIDSNVNSLLFFDYHTNGSSGTDWSKCMYLDLGGNEIINENMVQIGNYWIRKMTRDLVKKYSLTIDTDFMGFAYSEVSQGKVAEYALSLGMNAITIETWKKLPSEDRLYTPTTIKASSEVLGNFMIMCLRHFMFN